MGSKRRLRYFAEDFRNDSQLGEGNFYAFNLLLIGPMRGFPTPVSPTTRLSTTSALRTTRPLL
eukprot:scaffold109_cov252-Pinguiococcus_pyrenoidosus.AAC.12